MALTLPKSICLAPSRFVLGKVIVEGGKPLYGARRELNSLSEFQRNHFIAIRFVYGGNAT